MRYHFLTVVFLFFFTGCKQKDLKDDFNKDMFKKYQIDLFKQYAIYNKRKTEIADGDFVAIYSLLCGVKKYKIVKDYEVIQAYQLFTVKKNVYDSTFYYELMHFSNTDQLNGFINEIKEKNCIDEQTSIIHRIYRIGSNNIICVNYFNFNIDKFENFLKLEFNNELDIKIINISR